MKLTKAKIIEGQYFKEGTVLKEMPHIKTKKGYFDLYLEMFTDRPTEDLIDHISKLCIENPSLVPYIQTDDMFEAIIKQYWDEETLEIIRNSCI